jgi:thioredoxin 1
MTAATEYLTVDKAPSREEVERLPGLVLLEFGTEWCGFCRALAPHVSALLASHAEIQHMKVEDGPGRSLGRSFGVRVWPNLVLLRDGVVLWQLARPSAAELKDAFGEIAGAR